MKKRDLIEQVATRTGLSQSSVKRGIDSLLAILKQTLTRGQSVNIRGFGGFSVSLTRVRNTLPRYSLNRSPESLRRRSVRFRPARAITLALNDQQVLNLNNMSGGSMSDNPINETSSTGSADSAVDFFGLDVGTSRIVLASGDIGDIKSQTQLNAFVNVPYSKFTENILRQNKITYQLNNGGKEILIFGSESEKFANSFNVEARRSMSNGLLNPNEPNGWLVIQSIIGYLVKKTTKPDILCFSVPGAPRGQEANLVYHEGMIKNFLESLGYKAKSVNEGLSVVFAEMEKDNFTGIGISCGGGMCNVCFAFMSVPVFSFSISKAGDYIDKAVASVTNELPTRIRVIKEESLDLSKPPRDKYESAMHIYYEEMILTLVEGLRSEISESRNLPKLDRSIPIVLSGGTAKPKGFLEKFEKIFRQTDFPIKISDVRVAAEPLTVTARGCYIAAAYDS